MTPSSRRRIIRHLELSGALYPDDHPTVVESVIRALLHGMRLRREQQAENIVRDRAGAAEVLAAPPGTYHPVTVERATRIAGES